MIPSEVLKQVRRIEIKTGRLVTETFAGQYESIFKGRGIEFAEVREYIPGDDIRTIDWNVTARFGKPFIKKFIEERELIVVFLVDMSASNYFGTSDKFKNEISAELVSLLSLAAIKNNDKVSMIGFTDVIEKFITPKKGLKHILRIIREMIYYKPQHKSTSIRNALEYLNEVIKRKAVVFLMSDFLDKGFEKALKITGKKHDLIVLRIFDEKEEELQKLRFINIEDNETGESLTLYTADENFLKKYRNLRQQETENLKKLFKKSNIDNIDIRIDKPYIKPLMNFFKMRELRLK